MAQKNTMKIESELAKNISELTKQLNRFRKNDFFNYHTDAKKFLLFSFLQGLFRGFGAILGATILVGLFIFILSQITFIPIIGDFISNIIEYVERNIPTKPLYK